MHAANHQGGSLEIENMDSDRAPLCNRNHQSVTLDETRRSWLLRKDEDSVEKRKNMQVDLGCIVISRKALKWTFGMVMMTFLVIGLPIIIPKSLPNHKAPSSPSDDYAVALHKALLFFNAQKSGKLPKNNGISWRGNSGLQDGADLTDVNGGLVGGYYDRGDNTKFLYPMSFTMTMLSWSVIEYEHKYMSIKEYDHVRDLIKWGTDYMLLTFNSSASKIEHIHCQVGGSKSGSTIPGDQTCWERPEDMDYQRLVQTISLGSDLAGEMAAALAAASIVFRDDKTYSLKLIKGATTVWAFGRDARRRSRYSSSNPFIEPYYNSSGYNDEYLWGAAWMYYATGDVSYLSLATNQKIAESALAFSDNPNLRILSWDNKLPAAMLLLTRLRVFLSPGYPYETLLRAYHEATSVNMCAYLRQFQAFNWTRGGLIQLRPGEFQSLQYAANAAFLASLYVDYLDAVDVPGWNCGSSFIPSRVLRQFATSQVDYILGANPINMSYVVGYGKKYPTHVHHRGASIPNNNIRYSCKGGFKWLHSPSDNPNNITGAMVGGPDQFDRFYDVRSNQSYTEPTLAGNAGLVAALVSLTTSAGFGIDKNIMFSAVQPLHTMSPPPPQPWKP